jgi:hypothetical protein
MVSSTMEFNPYIYQQHVDQQHNKVQTLFMPDTEANLILAQLNEEGDQVVEVRYSDKMRRARDRRERGALLPHVRDMFSGCKVDVCQKSDVVDMSGCRDWHTAMRRLPYTNLTISVSKSQSSP